MSLHHKGCELTGLSVSKARLVVDNWCFVSDQYTGAGRSAGWGVRGPEQHLGSPEQEDYVAGLIFPQASPRGLGDVDKRVEVGSGTRHWAFTS